MEVRKKLREVKGWVKKKLKAGHDRPSQPSAPTPSEPEAGPLPDVTPASLPSPDTIQAGPEAQQSPSSLSPQATQAPPVSSTVETAAVTKESPKAQSSTLDPAVSATSTTSGNPTQLPANKSVASGLGVLEWVKSEGWNNLTGLLDTLNHATDTIGLGQVRAAIEMFANCVGIYEACAFVWEAAQGREEYRKLREHLEELFTDLRTHITSSPVITMSIDSICGSIKKELENIKLEKKKRLELRALEGGVRRMQEAEADTDKILKYYQRIQEHLERLSRNANISTWIIVDEIATENRLRDLAPSLWACYNSEKANELKRRPCTQGTRINVLAQMHQWVTSKDAGAIYWMSGMAGTGKTTIAYSLCEQLNSETTRLLCASFFCSRTLPECRDVGRIIPSIAYQLAQCSGPFRYALSEAMKKDSISRAGLPQVQFESLIMQPFSDPAVRDAFPTNMVVVIDALDECDDVKSTKQILDALLTKSRGLPIKFVVSSRPEPAIRDQMQNNGALVGARVVLHELDNGDVKTDIQTYLKAELEPIKPSEFQIHQLVARAGVLFIYAATVIRYVGYDDFGRDPQARLHMILGTPDQDETAPTNDIDDLYTTILRAAFEDPMLSKKEKDNMKLILNTVICARRSLTVDALNNLLRLGGVARVQAALRPLWSVLHVMGPNMIVTTLHASFPDYLLDSARSNTWFCDATSHHHLLAQRCFECIRDTDPQFNICRLESSYLLDNEVADLDARVDKFISTELRYAFQFWSSHLDATGSTTAADLIPLLFHFLTTHLLLWMEVRSLTKTLSAIPGELVTARRWGTRHDMPRDAIELLSDAWRFASTFVSTPISQSTPHLYISMLPLLSSDSPIRRHYMDRFRGMIGVEGTALGQRKDELLAEWKFGLYPECMACSPDGTRVAIGGGTRLLEGPPRLYLLDAFSGKLLHDLSQGEFYIYCVAFSPDSAHLVVGTAGGDMSVWDVITGDLVLGPFEAHAGALSSILYSHNGNYIVSASGFRDDETIRIWDALSGEPAHTQLIGHLNNVDCMAISSDDARLVAGCARIAIRIWDMKSGQLIMSTPEEEGSDYFHAIALTPDDSYIISASYDGYIRVWDAQTGQMVLGPSQDGRGDINSLSISPDGATMASVSMYRDDGLKILDVVSGKIISQLGPYSDEGHGAQVVYSPDGTHIIYANSTGTIRLLDAQTATSPSNSRPGHTMAMFTRSIDISSNGQHVVFGSGSSVSVWELTEEGVLSHAVWAENVGADMVRFSLDNTRVLSIVHGSIIRQWDARSGVVYGTRIEVDLNEHIMGETTFYETISFVAYSRDGARIVSRTSFGMLSVWDSSTGQCILGPIESQTKNLLHNSVVSSGYKNGSNELLDVHHERILEHSYQDHLGYDVLPTEYSSDGLYHAQFSLGGNISLRNLHTGEQMPGAFEGHTSGINTVQFTPDSTRLVSGSGDHTVHVWDVKTGQSIFGPLSGHTNWISKVALSPSGKFVVSTSGDLAIRVWNVQSEEPPNKDQDTEYANWVLDKDGWVVAGHSRRLFWVPTDLRTSLMWPRNTSMIHPDGYLRLSFEDAFLGEAWADCWHPS